ncbi:unnamed protein product [Cuscuta europaea]|uniref:No apical meristem-associated C-terminal domain-containing protein n=1 Tax=Cuscuta europaea TaxID=41803 RepID=A0A9P0Z7R9_CUSEU|nr:unnamed protein product [Cuscuta europaea]
MDSGSNPNLANLSSQIPNQFIPISHQFQPPYQLNPLNGSYPPYNDLPYGSHFSFQNLLNTPIISSEPTETHNSRGGGRRNPKDFHDSSNTSQPFTSKRDYWSSEENVALTKAWLRISTDPDVGNNQKLTAMWERILQVWRDTMGDKFNNARNSNTIQCRWTKIQKAINKFHGIYEKLERHPQSGSNPEYLKTKALRMYERLSSGNKKKEFKYVHCWELLIRNAKWCTNQLTRSSTSDKDCLVNGNTVVTDKNTPNVGNCSVEPEKVTCDEIVRPQGRKSCKERKRKLNSENGVIEALSKLQCNLDKQVEFNMAKMELKKELMKKEIELKEHSKK